MGQGWPGHLTLHGEDLEFQGALETMLGSFLSLDPHRG